MKIATNLRKFMQNNFTAVQAGKGGELTHDETTIIQGALDLTEKVGLLHLVTVQD